MMSSTFIYLVYVVQAGSIKASTAIITTNGWEAEVVVISEY